MQKNKQAFIPHGATDGKPPHPGPSERVDAMMKLVESRASSMGIGPKDVRPNVHEDAITYKEMAVAAMIAYAAGVITGGRLREELREAYVSNPDEWQHVMDIALAVSRRPEEQAKS